MGETRQTFTSSADTSFDVCFENKLISRSTFQIPFWSPIPFFSGFSHTSRSFNSHSNHTPYKIESGSNPVREIELDIDIGADARDWSAIQAQEKLKPVETDLRRIEEMVSEIVTELEYMRAREQKLRDTNESTNERVKWFAFGTIGMLGGLGAWQIVYLRAYFR